MRKTIRRFTVASALTVASLVAVAAPADAVDVAGRYCNGGTDTFSENAAGQKLACMFNGGGFRWTVVP